jgi:AAA+ superfamily predicted ATPase
MSNKPELSELFEPAITFPDADMKERLSMLVGLDDIKSRLTKILGLLVNPNGLNEWLSTYHPDAKNVTNMILRRPPLVVLAGDVGSGKSELAYAIGDSIARQEKIDITLLPLSLSTRGQGRVGEMTRLISAAFDHTMEQAKKLCSPNGKARGAIILLVDEADALAQSRENDQMHHEDKAGVNAFIRGIDSLGNGKLPAAVIMCTNRPNNLDPAIKRRAADIFLFGRPDDEQRRQVLYKPLGELGLSNEEINQVVSLTGARDGRSYGFTYSDITQRLIPTIVLDAYPNDRVTAEKAIALTNTIIPTSPFKES